MEAITRGRGIKLNPVKPARLGLLKHHINTDSPPFQTTTVVTLTANPTLGATPPIPTLDGSFVIFLNAVRVDMHFLICFCVFRELVIILKPCRMLRCGTLSNY